jgi:hypothetical protein
MRKLIVSNFVTQDGPYEGKDKISSPSMTTIMKTITGLQLVSGNEPMCY